MTGKAEKDKQLLENLEKLLAGRENEITGSLDDDTRTALDFARKMASLRESPSKEFKENITVLGSTPQETVAGDYCRRDSGDYRGYHSTDCPADKSTRLSCSIHLQRHYERYLIWRWHNTAIIVNSIPSNA